MRKKQRDKLEEKCLRTALVTWFNVNHDYLQEKLVCVPGDYIESKQPQIQLHWRKLIVEWLFEVRNACDLHDEFSHSHIDSASARVMMMMMMMMQFPAAFGVSMQAIAFAINLFDRYLCSKEVDKRNLQLCASKRAPFYCAYASTR